METEPSRTARELVSRINSRAAGDASCWDVFAWKPKLRFINMMRAGSSGMLSPSKLLWLQAALAEGVPPSTFEIWRWFGGALDGRVLRLTDYNLDRLDGWLDWGAQTEADLLWLVFVRNSDGMTWCGIEEKDIAQLRWR